MPKPTDEQLAKAIKSLLVGPELELRLTSMLLKFEKAKATPSVTRTPDAEK